MIAAESVLRLHQVDIWAARLAVLSVLTRIVNDSLGRSGIQYAALNGKRADIAFVYGIQISFSE